MVRDYTREMMDSWTSDGAQAAYDLGAKLQREIEEERDTLRLHEAAIQALGMVLRGRTDVDTFLDPATTDSRYDTIEAAERPRMIVEAALEVWNERHTGSWPAKNADFITTTEVRDELRENGFDLGVQQPLAVIGTVLSSADQFRKVARNTFEVIPPLMPHAVDDVDDLPF